MASLQFLDGDHLYPLRQAITNCLATSVAEHTYAQILDGQPTCFVYAGDHHFEKDWPVMRHKEICPGFLEKTRAFRSNFDVMSLEFNVKTLQAYQDTKCNSVAWKLRLIELVVSACHDIAVFLYQLDDGVHKHAEHDAWLAAQEQKYANTHSRARSLLPPPNLFWHGSFTDSHRYPNGVAELAGYWAETQIFGGVILFDRGQSGEECNGMYIQNIRHNFTLAPPTEQQFHQLVEFLLSPSPEQEKFPLPIQVTSENWWRWDPYEAMMSHNIFRNRFEIPEQQPPRSRRCVVSAAIWPELVEQYARAEEAAKKAAGEPYDESFLAESEARQLHITPTSRLWDLYKDLIAEQEPDKKKQGRPPYFFDP